MPPETIPKCSAPLLQNPAGFPIYRLFSERVLGFRSEMTIDADGAPNAYHPDDTPGLDKLANAGHPGNWWGVATDHGQPIIQASGPYAGFYVSTTALTDETKAISDVNRYVDSTRIPFHVLPGALLPLHGTGYLGDIGVVINSATGTMSASIFADIGPDDHLGEGSIRLAANLGLPTNLRDRQCAAGADAGIVYLSFPYTRCAPAWPVSIDIVEQHADAFIQQLGGTATFFAYLRQNGFL